MSTSIIKRSVAIDALASLALDRLARHRRKTRQEVLAELIGEFERLTTEDMTPAERRAYLGREALPTSAA